MGLPTGQRAGFHGAVGSSTHKVTQSRPASSQSQLALVSGMLALCSLHLPSSGQPDNGFPGKRAELRHWALTCSSGRDQRPGSSALPGAPTSLLPRWAEIETMFLENCLSSRKLIFTLLQKTLSPKPTCNTVGPTQTQPVSTDQPNPGLVVMGQIQSLDPNTPMLHVRIQTLSCPRSQRLMQPTTQCRVRGLHLESALGEPQLCDNRRILQSQSFSS